MTWDVYQYMNGMKKVYHGAMRGNKEFKGYKKSPRLRGSYKPTGEFTVTCPFCNVTFKGKQKDNECPFCGKEV